MKKPSLLAARAMLGAAGPPVAPFPKGFSQMCRQWVFCCWECLPLAGPPKHLLRWGNQPGDQQGRARQAVLFTDTNPVQIKCVSAERYIGEYLSPFSRPHMQQRKHPVHCHSSTLMALRSISNLFSSLLCQFVLLQYSKTKGKICGTQITFLPEEGFTFEKKQANQAKILNLIEIW